MEQSRHSVSVFVAEPGNQDRVQPIQVSTEIPETRFAAESAVDQHVEAVDPEERGVSLTAGENVKRRMAEADVAHDVGGRQRLLDGLGHEEGVEIGQKRVDGRNGLDDGVRIQLDLTELGELLLGQFVLLVLPVALRAAVDVDGDAVFVGAHHPLDFVFGESVREFRVGVQSVLQDPGSGPGEGVARVDDVPVFGEAAQHVSHALLQSVNLRVNQDLDDQIIRRVLDESFTFCKYIHNTDVRYEEYATSCLHCISIAAA